MRRCSLCAACRKASHHCSACGTYGWTTATEALALGIGQLTQLTSLEFPLRETNEEDIDGPSFVAVRCPPSSRCNTTKVHTLLSKAATPRLPTAGRTATLSSHLQAT